MAFSGGYDPFFPCGSTDGTDNNLESGMFIDFLRAFVEEYPQYSIRKTRLPRVRMDKAMREGRVDAFSLNSPLFVRPEDRSSATFAETIWQTGDHVVVRSGSKLKYAGPDSLAGMTIGVILGYGYGPLDAYLEDGRIRGLRGTSQEQMYRLLLAGKIDALIENRHSGPAVWKRMGYGPDYFRMLEPPVYEFGLGILVRNERQDFLRDMNAFVVRARASGLLRRIDARYGFLARVEGGQPED